MNQLPSEEVASASMAVTGPAGRPVCDAGSGARTGAMREPERALALLLRNAEARQRLLRLARRYAPAAEVEDAVHDGIVQALAQAASFRGEAQASTWMHRIVVNAALMRSRSASRRARHTEGFAVEAAVGTAGPAATNESAAPARLHERAQDMARVRHAVQDLPAPYREVTERCLLSEETPATVAAALGITEAGVRTRVQRARRQLRAALAA